MTDRNKKLSAFLAVVMSAAMLAGCGNAQGGDTADDTTAATEATTAAVEETGPVALCEPSGKAVIPQLESESEDIPANDALAFTQDMKIGWNLGNTLDAIDDSGSRANDLDIETAWVSVKTTKNIIDTLKAAGFNTVRVPISWHNHVNEDFTINEPFMERVTEIVNYVIDNDMYCIINIHHDVYAEYFYPNTENIETSTKYVTTIWQQLADNFGDYDEKLIFEGLNEPRLKDTGLEWSVNTNNADSLDSVQSINKLNQAFVDTVRASGGNNAERYLMVSGYAASPEGALNDNFVIPTDTADNKIIISVHAYTPYNFALQAPTDGGSTSDFNVDDSSASQITQFMDRLYSKFISNGTPVVIGEFGARNKNENLQARVDFAAYYVNAARERGITCCWWDNGAFYGSGENFGLMDRSVPEWKYPDIVLAMMEYAE